MSDPYIERWITVQDGLRLYVQDYPGPTDATLSPILCLGGLTRNSKDFAGLARFHAKRRRVICPDIRGRGRSDYDPVWQNYHPATYIGDVRHILCALGIHKVVVIGTSMGGIMGMVMGTAMPGAIKALVVNDVGPVVRKTNLGAIVESMKHPPRLSSWAEAGEHLRDVYGDQIPITDPQAWVLGAHQSYKEMPDGHITYDFDPNIVKPLLADKTERIDLWHFFRSCARVPLLTVRGAKSDILWPELFQEMQAARPDMVCVEVPEYGHAPSLSEPECREAMNDFLERY